MTEFQEIGNNDGGANPAHIRELFLIRKADIMKMQNPMDLANSGNYEFKPEMLELKPLAEIFKINFVWRSCDWTEAITAKIPNSYYNTIVFEISGTETQARKWVIDNMKHEFIAMFGNRANQTFIIGNMDVGLELTFTNKVSPKNMMLVSLAGEMIVPTFQTTEFDLDSFFGNYEFSDEFNLGTEFN